MVVTLTGSNYFMLKAELEQMIQVFVATHGELGLERLDGEEVAYDRVTEAIQSLPFLATKKLVVLSTPEANKQFAEQFGDLLGTIPDSTDLIIVEPKLDKRLSYYKTLKAKTDFREFGELEPDELAKWLVATARLSNSNLGNNEAHYLIERVGMNQQQLSSELQKLLDYSQNVTKETIDLLTEPLPQSTIFDLLETAFRGDMSRALELYREQRLLKVEPQQILAMLAWQLHVLAVVRAAGSRAPSAIASEAKLNPYVVNKSLGLARSLSLPKLKEMIAGALDIDVKLKTTKMDADEALQNYLIGLGQE